MRDKRTIHCGDKFDPSFFKITSFTNSTTLMMISINDSQHTSQGMIPVCLETLKVDDMEDVTLPHLPYWHVHYTL